MRSAATNHVVQVEGVTRRFGAVRAIDGVSFAVAEGERFGLATKVQELTLSKEGIVGNTSAIPGSPARI